MLFGAVILGHANTVPTGTIQVNITGLRSDKGQVILLLFHQGKGFPGDPANAIAMQRAEMQADRAIATFAEIPFGTYAVSVLHDENANAKMDTNFLGLPKEGWGTSLNPKPRLRAPKFDESKFQFSSPAQAVQIEMLYLR